MKSLPYHWSRRALTLGLLLYAGWSPAEPSIEFLGDSSSGVEAITNPTVRVVLSEPPSVPVSVGYQVTGGTAMPEGDYTLIPGVLPFQPGQRTNGIAFVVYNDGEPEPPETVVIVLDDPTQADLGQKTHHTYTILDDDSYDAGGGGGATGPNTVSFLLPSSSGPESQSPAQLEVVLGVPTSTTVRVEYRVTGGSAGGNGQDYLLSAGDVVFAPGVGSLRVDLQVINDRIAESNETVVVALTSPSGAQLGIHPTHVYTINDDDQVEVDFALPEDRGPEDQSPASIQVRVTGESERPIEVLYFVTGTAQPDADYVLDPGVLFFPPLVTQQVVEIEVIDDDLDEGDDTVILTLEQPDDVFLGTNSPMVYTIEDNDGPLPLVTVVGELPRPSDLRDGERAAAETVTTVDAGVTWEGFVDIAIHLQLDATSAFPVELDFVVGGTAHHGADYLILTNQQVRFSGSAGTAMIDPGETNATILIEPIEDSIPEPDESVIVTITNAVGARLGAHPEYVLWLRDNDRPEQTLTFFRQVVPSVESNRSLVVLGPRTATVLPKGLAVDRAGNYYIADQGPARGEGEGAILMWPAGGDDVLSITEGLTRPGDIELTTDGRALVIGGPGGEILRRPFGLSIHVTGIATFGEEAVVYVKTDLGTRQAFLREDGYFHVRRVLDEGQSSATVDVVIEYRGESRVYPRMPLGQPGFKKIFGQTLMELEF